SPRAAAATARAAPSTTVRRRVVARRGRGGLLVAARHRDLVVPAVDRRRRVVRRFGRNGRAGGAVACDEGEERGRQQELLQGVHGDPRAQVGGRLAAGRQRDNKRYAKGSSAGVDGRRIRNYRRSLGL